MNTKICIDSAIIMYINDSKSYYNGSREPLNLDWGLRAFFCEDLRSTLDKIRTPMLARLRDHHARSGKYSRSSINKMIGYIRRFLSWCAEQDLVPAQQVYEIQSLRKLQYGRHGVIESPRVEPAVLEDVMLVRQTLKPGLAQYIDMMLYTGMRPGEARIMRAQDLELVADRCYVYSPSKHKTEHHGKTRFIAIIGPAFDLADDLIRQVRADSVFKNDEYLFSPKGDGSKPYAEFSISRAIRQRCDALGIMRWSPNRIRHRVATNFDEGGHETKTISTVMGHSSTRTTHIYIHEQKEKVIQAALKLAG